MNPEKWVPGCSWELGTLQCGVSVGTWEKQGLHGHGSSHMIPVQQAERTDRRQDACPIPGAKGHPMSS